jgi:HEAT repeat protein
MNAMRTIVAIIGILNVGRTDTVAKEDVASLIDQLGAWNKDEAKKASEELAAMGREAVPELIEALNDGGRRQRRFAARSLRQIGQDAVDAIPALIASLGYSDDLTREYAVEALGKMVNETERVMPVLRQATKDSNQSVREHARASISHLTELLASRDQSNSSRQPASSVSPKAAPQSRIKTEVSKSDSARSSDVDNAAVLGAASSGKEKLMILIRCALFACIIAGFFTLLYVYRENN